MPDLSCDEMAAIHAASFTTPRPWTAAEIAALLESPLVFAITCPAGFLLGRAIAGEAELLTVAVNPMARRRGLGAKLVSGFLAEAKKRHAEDAFLEVAGDNQAAQTLYLAQGFTLVSRRKGYYRSADGSQQDALIFNRKI